MPEVTKQTPHRCHFKSAWRAIEDARKSVGSLDSIGEEPLGAVCVAGGL